MKQNLLRRILAIIALVFMLAFSAFLVMLFVSDDLFPGLQICTWTTGGVGIGLWFVLYMLKRADDNREKLRKQLEGEPDDGAAEPETADAAEKSGEKTADAAEKAEK